MCQFFQHSEVEVIHSPYLITVSILNFASPHFGFSRSSFLFVILPIIRQENLFENWGKVFTHFFELYFENQIPAIPLVHVAFQISFPFFSCSLFISITNELLAACFNFLFKVQLILIPGSSYLACIFPDIQDTAFFAGQPFFPSLANSLLTLNSPSEMAIQPVRAGTLLVSLFHPPCWDPDYR